MRAVLRLTGVGTLNGQAIAQIQPGSWPNLQTINLFSNNFSDDPVGVITRFLHLTSLLQLNLTICGFHGEATSLIKPGDGPHLQNLNISSIVLVDNSVGAMKGLLRVTNIREMYIHNCRLTGEAISQMTPFGWPHLKKLTLCENDVSDDHKVARNGLLHPTYLDALNRSPVTCTKLTFLFMSLILFSFRLSMTACSEQRNSL
jgi:hypothetical protein